MPDSELADVVRSRDIRPAPLKDFFDLAEALLDATSVQQQLARLDRPTLTALAALATFAPDTPAPMAEVEATVQKLSSVPEGPGAVGVRPDASAAFGSRFERASRLMLVELSAGSAQIYASVARQLRSWPAFGLPTLEQLASETAPAALESVSAADAAAIDRIAAEHAFTATSEISELLAELERGPARELTKGGVALPDTKRLANAMSVDLGAVAEQGADVGRHPREPAPSQCRPAFGGAGEHPVAARIGGAPGSG